MIDCKLASQSLTFSETKFPGLLVVFCGLDGSGKTTLINSLVDALTQEGRAPFTTKQPTDAVRESSLFKRVMYTADSAREIEYRAHSLITVSDRVQHSLRVILPKLNEGKIVISDRYFFSALANLRARGYRQDNWIYELGNLLPRPDIAFFCEPPFDLILRRLQERESERSRFFDLEFNKALYREFVWVRTNYAESVVLDTSDDPKRTRELIESRVFRTIQNKLATYSRST